MLWQRLVFGSLLIALVVGIVALDAYVSKAGAPIGSPTVSLAALPFITLLALIAILATFEMGKLCQAGGHQPATLWAAFVAAGLIFVPWMEMQCRLGQADPLFVNTMRQVSPTVIWIAGGLLGTCLLALARRTTERALGNMAVTCLMFLYLGLLGSFLARIRCMTPGPAGAALAIYVILVIKSSDIGAYFTGSAIGRHKLAPWLSPAKTIEGAVGAVAWATLVAVAGMAIWPRWAVLGPAAMKLPQAAVFGAVIAVFAHLGDLVESAFKRDMKIKDSGHLIPAFGGLLDLLDSLLFAAPIAWLGLTIWVGSD
jgi:phosphatidate cytidylyltransferase